MTTETIRTISLRDQTPAAPAEPPHLPILDVATSADGQFLTVLTAAGQIFRQELCGWLNTPPAERPERVWTEISAPAGATRIFMAAAVLHALADGVLYRRVRDTSDPNNMWRPIYTWQPVPMPDDRKV
jgi:hypothetical protein